MKSSSQNGLTLVELLVALVSAFIVFSGIASLMISSAKTFARNENTMLMANQANAILDRVGDDLMQAGADLPVSLKACSLTTGSNPTNSFRLLSNEKGAVHVFLSAIDTNKITDEKASYFQKGPLQYFKPGSGVQTSIKVNDTINNIITLDSTTKFEKGDVIYQADTINYIHNSSDSTLNRNFNNNTVIFGKNIAAFSVTFRDITGITTTSDWTTMASCSLYVKIRSATKDSSNAYRYKESSKVIYMRNR